MFDDVVVFIIGFSFPKKNTYAKFDNRGFLTYIKVAYPSPDNGVTGATLFDTTSFKSQAWC